MGLNSLGLGFSFGSKDTGMGKELEAQTQHLSLMGKAVETLDKILSINRLQTFIESVSLSKLGDIADGIAGIAEKGRNLTTSFESTMVANNKSGMAMAANLGYAAKDMDKFADHASGMSVALNTSVETAGKAIYAWKNGQDELKNLGVMSEKAAVNLEEVFHVDPSKLIYQLKEMKGSLGMSDDAIRRVTDSTLAWGQQSGDVSKALNSLPAQIASMQEHAHSLGKTLSGDEVAKYAESTNQAAMLMYQFSGNAETAEAAARDLGKRMIGAGKDFAGMFAGTQQELPKMFEGLTKAGVNFDDTFKLMKQGPLGFIQGMADVVKKAGGFANMTDDQMNFVKKQMEDAVGPDVANQMFALFQKGGTAVDDFVKHIPKATGSIGDLANHARKDGRTLSELMDVQEQQFIAQIRHGSKAGDNFVRESGKAYTEWGNKLVKLSKDDGPLGSIARKMIEMHQIGAQALVPKALRPMASVLGTIAKESAPLIGILSSMGFSIGFLISPLGLVVGAFALLAYWFVSVHKKGESFGKTIDRMAGQWDDFWSKTFPKYLQKGLDYFNKISDYLAKVVPPLLVKLGAFIEKNYPIVVDAFKKVFAWVFEKAIPWLGEVVPPLLTKLGDAIRKYAPIAVKAALDLFTWLAKELWGYLPTLLSTFGDLLKAGLGLAKDIILGVFEGIRTYLVEKFPGSADLINNVFKTISEFVTDTFDFVKDFIDFAVDSWKVVLKFFTDVFTGQISIFSDTWDGIKLMFQEKIQDIKSFFQDLWTNIKIKAEELFHSLPDTVMDAVKAMGKILSDATEIFTSPFKAIDGWVDKLFRNSISTDMKVDFDAAKDNAKAFSKDMSKSMSASVAPLDSAGITSGRPGGLASAGDRDASLVGAVNMPAWYGRYEALFNTRMTALEAALSGTATPRGGGRTASGTGSTRSGGMQPDDGLAHATAMNMHGNPTRSR